MPKSQPGFAVVDVETTGFSPTKDRVIEVAVVHVDEAGGTTGEFSTLVNPVRDVGPTRIHKIHAADVVDAPRFADIAAELWDWLATRVLVAHNASFDVRMLDAEFERCGVRLPPPPVMCTMRLASQYLPGLPARSLQACCDGAKVNLSNAHTALDDARAAAALLACFRAGHRDLPESWRDALQQAAAAVWIPAPRSAEFHVVPRGAGATRSETERPPLAHVVDQLPRGNDAKLHLAHLDNDSVDEYFALLDRVLEDRILTEDETQDLATLAGGLGLTADSARQAHRRYLEHVASAAWRDRVVTDAERLDYFDVARLLDVAEDDATGILEQARTGPLADTANTPARVPRPGDRVVFTGDMLLSRAEIEALATVAGLKVTGSVSRKTALLVEADPYSQSTKAKAAKALGVRRVTEQVFLYLLDQMAGIDRGTSESFTSAQPAAQPSMPPAQRKPPEQLVMDDVATEVATVGPATAQRRHPAAGWYSDSDNLMHERWWDGDKWTAHVRPRALPLPAWYPDPYGKHRWRWWDGARWTDHTH
jgi:DNA polymerase-3 subunit epsilon